MEEWAQRRVIDDCGAELEPWESGFGSVCGLPGFAHRGGRGYRPQHDNEGHLWM